MYLHTRTLFRVGRKKIISPNNLKRGRKTWNICSKEVSSANMLQKNKDSAGGHMSRS